MTVTSLVAEETLLEELEFRLLFVFVLLLVTVFWRGAAETLRGAWLTGPWYVCEGAPARGVDGMVGLGAAELGGMGPDDD